MSNIKSWESGSVIGFNMFSPLTLKQLLEYKSKYVLTFLILVWEIVCQHFAQCVAVTLIAISIGILGLPQFLGAVFSPWLHLLILIFLLILFLLFLMRAVRNFSLPSKLIIERRLELNSGFYHRPFETISDRVINNKNLSTTLLWNTHRERAFNSLKRLKVGMPIPVFSFCDPYAFRAGIGVLLTVALVVGWKDAGDRLLGAIKPDFSRDFVKLETRFDVWLNPPSYTRIAPILLNSKPKNNPNKIDFGQTIKIPQGSTVLANSLGNHFPLRLIVKSQQGTIIMSETLRKTNSDMLQAELKDLSGSNLSLCQKNNCLASWDLQIIPDNNPKIDFLQAPIVSTKGELQLAYNAIDDYGVKEVSARIGLEGDNAEEIDEEVLEIQLPSPITPKRELIGRKMIDFGPHPWSGRLVWLELRVTDEIGQIGKSSHSKIKLPIRVFHHPVARQIVRERELLIALPETRARRSDSLFHIAGRANIYGHDVAAFLSLKSASARLLFNDKGTEDESVINLLWNTALRVEQGKLHVPQQRLTDLQRQLQNALSKGESKENIRHLIDQFETAVERYLSNLENKMSQKKSTSTSEMRSSSKHKKVQRRQIREMVKRLRDVSDSGMRMAASQMLNRMLELLNQLSTSANQQPSVSEDIIHKLGKLAVRQRLVMDETFQKSKRKSVEGKKIHSTPSFSDRKIFKDRPLPLMKRSIEESYDPNSSKRLSNMQMKLHDDLGELLNEIQSKLGPISKDFRNAKTFMGQAGRALTGNQLDDAIGLQNQVLTHIQRGGRSLIDGIDGAGKVNPNDKNNNLDQINGNRGFGGNPQRSIEYFFNSGKEILPNDYKMQKARQIIEELRKRSADNSRPLIERKYIERLLEQF